MSHGLKASVDRGINSMWTAMHNMEGHSQAQCSTQGTACRRTYGHPHRCSCSDVGSSL